MQKYLSLLKRFDIYLVILPILVVCFGLAALYSIGLGREAENFVSFKKQLLFLAIGVVVYLFFAFLDYRFWKSYAKFLYVFSVLMLGLVLIFGQNIRGTTGWFVFFGYQFQPVELLKFLLPVSLAYYFSSCPRPLNGTKNIAVSFGLMSLLFALTLLQPDLGSAMLLFFIWVGFVFLAGLRFWQWAALAGVALVALAGGWFFVFHDYQKDRIESLFSGNSDTLGEGYAVNQSIIAIGSGQMIGRGLGFGSQSQLKFLPESHTDFIFSVISEELGFVGAFLLLIFYGVMLFRILQVSRYATDDFSMFLSSGIAVIFFCQVVLNVSVTLGLLPVTGVTFPLLSYGGSSLLVSMMMLGVVQSIHLRRQL